MQYNQKLLSMKKIIILPLFLIGFVAIAQDCSNLFISEYVEGPGNNNALEIYNPTTETISLDGYSINRYSNGGSDIEETWPLSGSLEAGQAISIGNGQVDSVWVDAGGYWSLPVDDDFYNACNLHCSGEYPTPFYFNGDDAITLEKDGQKVDIFGKIGEDPGGAWTDDPSAGFTDANGGDWLTKRQTLVRKASVKSGVSTNPVVFNPTLEWDSLPDGTYDNLGYHDCNCPTETVGIKDNKISYNVFPNPITTSHSFEITASEEILSYKLYNILGGVVLENYAHTFKATVNTFGIAKGIYTLSLKFEDQTKLEKILIQ